jgi:hypothetical protein
LFNLSFGAYLTLNTVGIFKLEAKFLAKTKLIMRKRVRPVHPNMENITSRRAGRVVSPSVGHGSRSITYRN